ncbi:MAG: molybdopterin converting factor subunit 1 [Gammaproteobacteria bacterium]|jgi:molybdopterin synthase sulfur carrier subunit|nr:molybdopterin converting factor subunit 1 [Gammaproteobacteria bacterium]MDG2337272.1 molybdopterin converting factor subunit 1 [Gammaproteobacteria bacterium]
MLRIQYFASIRETLGRSDEELELPAQVGSVQDLIDHLLGVNPSFQRVFSAQNMVLTAVNQTVVDLDHPISENDEVAFFPPMTGG